MSLNLRDNLVLIGNLNGGFLAQKFEAVNQLIKAFPGGFTPRWFCRREPARFARSRRKMRGCPSYDDSGGTAMRTGRESSWIFHPNTLIINWIRHIRSTDSRLACREGYKVKSRQSLGC